MKVKWYRRWENEVSRCACMETNLSCKSNESNKVNVTILSFAI